MRDEMLQRIVFTGGPGSGKSTLIRELIGMGYAVSPESGRAIMQQQMAIEGHGLPGKNLLLYAELMLARDMQSYLYPQTDSGPVFYDRGIPDTIGYLRTIGEEVAAHFFQAVRLYRYHRKVFLFPPWVEIYAQDSERKQPFEEAVRTCDAMESVYADAGYEVVEVPKAPVMQRVAFVLSELARTSE